MPVCSFYLMLGDSGQVQVHMAGAHNSILQFSDLEIEERQLLLFYKLLPYNLETGEVPRST